jgi:pimeloyl-ACP methyl ester carboxylesterase
MNDEVRFRANGVEFAGTLTLPGPGIEVRAAVVFISGGNPVDRDSEVEGFRPFRLIADHLAGHGVASVRYDDRGVGGSGGTRFWDSNLDDHEREVLAAVELLRSRSEIGDRAVGLIGHSWGGTVAGRVAAGSPEEVAFFVTLGSPGQNGDRVMLEVRRALLAGRSDEEVREGLRVQTALHEAARRGAGLDRIEDDFAGGFLRDLAGSRFFQTMMVHDPLPTLSRVRCPVLLCFGGGDLFVPVEPHLALMRGALDRGGNDRFEELVVPRAEHLFRDAEFSMDEFAPGFLERLTGWILAQADRPPRP